MWWLVESLININSFYELKVAFMIQDLLLFRLLLSNALDFPPFITFVHSYADLTRNDFTVNFTVADEFPELGGNHKECCLSCSRLCDVSW